MYFMNYDSVKLTNYVQRFCIISRVRDGVAAGGPDVFHEL
nr:MAG TPA: hypothetical protein [Caudoviricetes sp.]